MSNTVVWDSFSKPPRSALKQIGGGRLKGMTDINPQWRYRAMTEQFGPCGVGWVHSIDKLWTEKGAGDEVMCFALISLRINHGGIWSEPIHGVGGSAMIAMEKGGLRGSDECYKMAVTDALSVAMKMLGVASDIYMGLWDGTKYRDADTSATKVIAATDGALERVENQRLDIVIATAEGIIERMGKDDLIGAYELSMSITDADERVAMWGQIKDSKIKSTLKKHHDSLKEVEIM